MAKRRKTRKQKKLADLRHTFTHSLVAQQLSQTKIASTKNITTQAETKFQNVPSAQPVIAHTYLIKDLSKTAMLTAAIIAFQVLLFLMIKNHVFAIPGLNY